MRYLVLILTLTFTSPALADFEADRATEAAAFTRVMRDCPIEEEADCARKFFDACSERHGWTTVAMVLCAAARHDHWSRAADTLWQDILPRTSGALREHLEALAAARETWRDRECATYGFFEGTMWRTVASDCAADASYRWFVLLRDISDAAPLAVVHDGIDLDCDGRADRVLAQQPDYSSIRIDIVPGGSGPTVPVITLPVDTDSQIALCGRFVELETLPGPGACPVLRISDGMCDAIYLHRDLAEGNWVVGRN
jgi:hypothetical protein